ncbi:hypothetical protein [Teredinibacter turnerae]|uniref:hypothetical protein n=1 Tax=Teredinibacter turnerae TaxID=2426 RepID=UPI00036F0B63|nr:hypothetical protein [Teredinibacter turnerae]
MSSILLKHPEKDVDLGVFLPFISRPFLTAVQKSCSDAAKYSLDHFNSIWASIKLLFKELNELAVGLLGEINSGVATFGEKISWMKFIALVRCRLERRKITSYAKNSYISGINYTLNRLQYYGYIPRFDVLSTFKPEKKVSKSLLEFTFDDKEIFSEIVAGDDAAAIERVMHSLAAEMNGEVYENIADQCAYLLKKRLALIRSEAEMQFSRYAVLRKSGLVAIRKYRSLLPIIDRWIEWRRSKSTGSINPYNDEIKKLSNEQWWGVYLAWCWYRNGGVEPKCSVLPTRIYNMLRKQFLSRKDARADVSTAEAIGCSMGFIASASILLVHDLVANVDSIRNILVDADYITDYGVVDIEWVKPRARGFLTAIDEGEQKYSPSKVIRTIRKATRCYRKTATDQHKGKLFLHHHSAKGSSKKNSHQKHITPMVPTSSTLLTHIKKVIKSASGGEWGGTARSIRVSLLLYKGLTGGLIAVQQAAQHNSLRTSMLYANSIPMRMSFDQKMREFREWLQVLVTIDIENVAIKIGLDEDKYRQDKEKIIASQFGGVYCRDPMAGVQPGTKKGEVCWAISQCMTCNNKRNIFVVTEENVVHLLQWNEALKSASRAGYINVMKEAPWAFWCVFIESVLEKMFQSGEKYKAILHSSQRKLPEIDNPYLKIDFRLI